MAYQGQVAAAEQQAAQMQAELQMHEEQERERRTQAAINEAIAKERQRNEQTRLESGAMANTTEVTGGRAPPIYNSAPADAKTVRYCRQCGNACRVGDKFCTQCGCMQEETG
jgi:hypothetical protein